IPAGSLTRARKIMCSIGSYTSSADHVLTAGVEIVGPRPQGFAVFCCQKADTHPPSAHHHSVPSWSRAALAIGVAASVRSNAESPSKLRSSLAANLFSLVTLMEAVRDKRLIGLEAG